MTIHKYIMLPGFQVIPSVEPVVSLKIFYVHRQYFDSGMLMSSANDTTIRQVQGRIKKFLEEQGKDWTQIDNRFYLFTHMSEEVGELARHIITAEFGLNLDRMEKAPTPREKMLSLIEDDLGDILYHIFKLAIAYNVDLTRAIEEAVSNIERRYRIRSR